MRAQWKTFFRNLKLLRGQFRSYQGYIRHHDSFVCPVVAVAGSRDEGDNDDAVEVAVSKLDFDEASARLLVQACDGYPHSMARQLRTPSVRRVRIKVRRYLGLSTYGV